jgi:DNA-directed RNA polymerase subunit beta
MEKNPYLERKTFRKTNFLLPVDDLIKLPKESYDKFLQMKELPHERKRIGIQAAFEKIFPIKNFKETASLEFVEYNLGKWSCKCGKLVGVENARPVCKHCGNPLPMDVAPGQETVCPSCGKTGDFEYPTCDKCGTRVGLKLAHSPEECIDKGYTYSIPLYVKLRLIVEDEEGAGHREIKEQGDIYFGEIPIMTESGSFIINGTERVIVNQLHQAPGVIFHRDKKSKEKKDQYKKDLKAVIMAHRGAKLEFVIDKKNILFARINEKKKIPITTLLRAIKLEDDSEIIRKFYKTFRVKKQGEKYFWKFEEDLLTKSAKEEKTIDQKIVDPDTKEIIAKKGAKLNKELFKKLKKIGIEYIALSRDDLKGAALVAKKAGVELEIGDYIDDIGLDFLSVKGEEFEIFFPEKDEIGTYLINTLRKDSIKMIEDAYNFIFKQLRPGEPFHSDQARIYFHNLFFNPKRYDLSPVGRYKINLKLGIDEPLDKTTLSERDIIETIKYYLRLLEGNGGVEDDRDHLGNRRVRPVGELVTDQFGSGLQRLEKMVKEKLIATQELRSVFPKDLINSKPITASLKEFFGTSELSQFLDQTNPLAEITHKRRISALGPGGLKRERAGFEVRDVHISHYGRICPIETPEGQNIGLIVSLSTFARINEFGFLVAPYRKVENGVVKDYYKIITSGDSKFKPDDIIEKTILFKEMEKLKKSGKTLPIYSYNPFYLTPWEEERHIISQATTKLDEKGKIIDEKVTVRKEGEFTYVPRNEVEYMDVSPQELVSISASLIPFLEHDDANRALMGSNMQRQAVPLVRPDSPVVGTGVEYIAGKGSKGVVLAKRPGIVEKVDANRIIIKVDEEEEDFESKDIGADLYVLSKFRRSNQDTLVNQRPIVKKGDKVRKGQVIADSSTTDKGELALGKNLVVAFLPWRGYNYEDAILISNKLVEEDTLTSIHIKEVSTEARETKFGQEEITKDLPLKGERREEKLRNLDDSGIIKIGSYVKPGDILVGKISPKAPSQLTPEEKLLKAIFGHKALEIKDASLRCPPGVAGTVIDVKIYTRRGVDKDERAKQIEEQEIERLKKNMKEEIEILNIEAKKILRRETLGRVIAKDFKKEDIILKKKEKLRAKIYDKLELEDLFKIRFEKEPEKDAFLDDIRQKIKVQIESIKMELNDKIDSIRKGDDLSPGILKVVKVFISMKRKIQEGDKLAGRHGNKGCISRILPVEDMPFLEDGTPVDVVLNPLGVPSRMNVGQILETHLGWAAKALGWKVETPVFDGAKENEIRDLLKEAKLPETGQTKIYDGKTGEPFDQKATVGVMYVMKLVHMAEDKAHARSTGPYSLITQQPLGGKAQFGGQRFGEMEVWALEAYGAAYTLQEMLTAKSDDVEGRNKIYESIVKGTYDYTPSLPESFNVLIRELMSLSINVELGKKTRINKFQVELPSEEEESNINF